MAMFSEAETRRKCAAPYSESIRNKDETERKTTCTSAEREGGRERDGEEECKEKRRNTIKWDESNREREKEKEIKKDNSEGERA